MITMDNLPTVDYEIPLYFHRERKENRVMQKICDIGKGIFNYLRCHQHALAIAICSYAYIDIRIAASELGATEVYNLASCQDTVCEYWNKSSEAHTNFSPSIEFRCNSSNPDYHPFDFFEKCMQELCKYMSRIGKHVSQCIGYLDHSELTYESNSISSIPIKVWQKICPKKKFNLLNQNKQIKYLAKCFKKICAYHNARGINDTMLSNLCYQLPVNSLNREIKKLSKAIKKSTIKPMEKTNNLEEASLLASVASSSMSILSSVASIASILLAAYATKVALSTAKVSIPSLSAGLRDIMMGAVQTTRAIIEEPPNHLPRNTIESVSQFSNNIEAIFLDANSHISESREHSFSYYEDTHEVPLEGNPRYETVSDKSILEGSVVAAESVAGSAVGDAISAGGISGLAVAAGGVAAGGVEGSAVGAGGVGNIGVDGNKGIPGNILVDGSIIAGSAGAGIGGVKTAIESDIATNQSEVINLLTNYSSLEQTTSEVVSNLGFIVGSTVDPGLRTGLEFNDTFSHNETFFSREEYAKFNITDLGITSDEYADFLLEPSFDSTRIEAQLSRIEHSLEYWKNSYCIYEFPKILFCRPNLYHNPIEIPLEFIRSIISKSDDLCYYLKSGVWCDWNQFFYLLADKMSITRNINIANTLCPWDHVSLSVENMKDSVYRINATGACYQETFTFRSA